jgi:hypothetical protein
LRLVLDWLSQHSLDGHVLDFADGASWYSEALLPSQFLPRTKSDPLGEGYTHADGVVGHIVIGNGSIANTILAGNASQFVVTEAKLFSRLSPSVTHALGFDQAARSVACIAEVLFKADRKPDLFSSLGFVVLAPREQIQLGLFKQQVSKTSIKDKVTQRVQAYRSPDREKKDIWLDNWLLPTLDHMKIDCLPWEEIIQAINHNDSGFGSELSAFYVDCLRFNRIQEPDINPPEEAGTGRKRL